MTIILQTDEARYTLWNVTGFSVLETKMLPDKHDFIANHSDRPKTMLSVKVESIKVK